MPRSRSDPSTTVTSLHRKEVSRHQAFAQPPSSPHAIRSRSPSNRLDPQSLFVISGLSHVRWFRWNIHSIVLSSHESAWSQPVSKASVSLWLLSIVVTEKSRRGRMHGQQFLRIASQRVRFTQSHKVVTSWSPALTSARRGCVQFWICQIG